MLVFLLEYSLSNSILSINIFLFNYIWNYSKKNKTNQKNILIVWYNKDKWLIFLLIIIKKIIKNLI